MSSAIKRQRTDELNMMTGAASREHMGAVGLKRGGRGGESAVGGTLRLNVWSCLKPTEAEILGMMLEAVKLSKSGTVVRVAGGWVRDKLLGLENEDIDIALDNCTGVAFAEMLNNYLKSKGQDEGKVAVIEANPEQSKHLETARMKVMGVWVDLVNLRTEVYRSDSRIPEASLGTAEEDALRRDFTLNALFYNVNEGKVEDKTGRGMDDLRDGIIRTPLPPMNTFQDDPLRVLRAVRFAARFGFTLHEDLRAAAQDNIIQAALGTKVSRERVGAELSGMITGKMAQPALALSLLQELGLAPAVYAPPEHLVPPPPEGGFDWARGTAVARAAARLLAFRSNVTEVREEIGRPESEAVREHVLLAAAVQDAESMSGLAEDANAGSGGVALGAGAVVVGTTLALSSAQTHDGTPEGGEANMEGNEKADATAPGGKDRESKGGDERSRDQKKTEAPATLVRELFICAALLPLTGVKHKAKKGKLVSAAQSIVSDSLKLKAKEAKNVGDILELSRTFRSLADANMTTGTSGDSGAAEVKADEAERASGAEFSRLSVGLALRQARELWPTCVDLCCAVDMCDIQQRRPPPPSTAPPPPPTGADAAGATCHQEQAALDGGTIVSSVGKGPQADGDGGANIDAEFREGGKEQSVIDKYTGFRKAVASMGLERAWDMAPLVRGNELMAELQLPKGPEIGKQMAKQITWQLEHPEGTREQCIAFLRTTLSEENRV